MYVCDIKIRLEALNLRKHLEHVRYLPNSLSLALLVSFSSEASIDRNWQRECQFASAIGQADPTSSNIVFVEPRVAVNTLEEVLAGENDRIPRY
jgi:hypothetical protein